LVAGLVWGIVSASPAHSQNGDEVATVYQQAVQLYQAGKYIEAVPFSERYVKLTQERVGPDHADYATALHGLGTVYHLSGRNGEAEAAIAQSLAIREKLMSRDRAAREVEEKAKRPTRKRRLGPKSR
jgi:hypothetical protein